MNFKNFIGQGALASLYFSFSCILYSYGYWKSFGINPFEYLSINDIMLLGVLPFAALAAYVYLAKESFLAAKRYLSSRHIYMRVAASVLLVCLMIFSLLEINVLTHQSGLFSIKWTVIPTILICLLALVIQNAPIFKELSEHFYTRYYIVIIILSVPAICLFVGRLNGFMMETHLPWNYVISKDLSSNINGGYEGVYKLLGKLGSHYFITPISNSPVIILNEESIDYIKIYSRPDVLCKSFYN